MPRRKARTDEELADEELEHVEALGYRRLAHKEKDESPTVFHYALKTKKEQDKILRRYLIWRLSHWRRECRSAGLRLPTLAEADREYLSPDTPFPSAVDFKDFIRYKVMKMKGVITPLPTVDSIKTHLESFFSGFWRRTGSYFANEDRTEFYKFVKYVLTAEGLCIDIHLPKYNFHLRSVDRLFFTNWTHDDLVFVPDLYRVQYNWVLWNYCFSGARVDTFFAGKGLCWRDVQLILQREEGRPWRAAYKLDMRYVKNNKNPEHMAFGTCGKDDRRLVYNGAFFLLNMAIVAGVLFGIKSVADLYKQRILPGETEKRLVFEDGAEMQPVLRTCTLAHGVSNKPMKKQAFLNIHTHNVRNAGFVFGGGIHPIRRACGKGVNERYTDVQLGQHLGQTDLRVYGQSYVANCSSVDGHGAFLGEEADHRHIDYFQSVEQFRRTGLPVRLPAALKHELETNDAGLCKLKKDVQRLKHSSAATDTVKEAENHLRSYRTCIYRRRLDEYQRQWSKDRDRQDILCSDEAPATESRTDMTQHLCLLVPERGRLAQAIVTKAQLSWNEEQQAMEDMVSLCRRDQTVLYLPGLSPDGATCPARACTLKLKTLEKRRRNEHVLGCLRKERAQKEGLLESDVHYCRRCFQWVAGRGKWASHCATHLKDLRTKRCAPQVYCHTLLWTSLCPECAGDERLPPDERLREYGTDAELWDHTEKHFKVFGRPLRCDYPLCDKPEFETVLSMRYHLIDSHRYSSRFTGADEGDFALSADLDGELADSGSKGHRDVGDSDLHPEGDKCLPNTRAQTNHVNGEPLQFVPWSPAELMKPKGSPVHAQTVCTPLLDQHQPASDTPSRDSSCVHTPPTLPFAHALNITDEEMEEVRLEESPSRPKDNLTAVDWSAPVDRAADDAMFSEFTCIDSLAKDAALAPSYLPNSVQGPGFEGLGEHSGAQKPKILLRFSKHPAQRGPKESCRKSAKQSIGCTKLKLTLHCKASRIQKRQSRQKTRWR